MRAIKPIISLLVLTGFISGADLNFNASSIGASIGAVAIHRDIDNHTFDTDITYSKDPEGSFCFGLNFDAEFIDIEGPGKINYNPGIDFWFRRIEETGDYSGTTPFEENIKVVYSEISLNLIDLRYILPIFNITEPYAGTGFALRILSVSSEAEYSFNPTDEDEEKHKTRVRPGLNLSMGSDFRITDKFIPFTEVKLRVIKPVTFRLNIGARISI